MIGAIGIGDDDRRARDIYAITIVGLMSRWINGARNVERTLLAFATNNVTIETRYTRMHVLVAEIPKQPIHTARACRRAAATRATCAIAACSTSAAGTVSRAAFAASASAAAAKRDIPRRATSHDQHRDGHQHRYLKHENTQVRPIDAAIAFLVASHRMLSL